MYQVHFWFTPGKMYLVQLFLLFPLDEAKDAGEDKGRGKETGSHAKKQGCAE
jgi:hypothetical protein